MKFTEEKLEKQKTMEEIKQLLTITQKLKDKYIHLNKHFSLDGKLVGDIGEVLAAEKYGIELYPENTPVHDGFEITTKRNVQIKATFKGGSYFPLKAEKMPDYFLSVLIKENGDLEEQYNGPGQFLMDNAIKAKNRKPDSNGFNLKKNILQELNRLVPEEEKIKEVKP